MKTLRWTHAYLDQRIVTHKRRVQTAGYLQRWWKQYLEAAAIKKKALAYSAHLRAQEAARKRSVQEQREHDASKILQEWSTFKMIEKHKYASRVFSSLHQRLRTDSCRHLEIHKSSHLLKADGRGRRATAAALSVMFVRLKVVRTARQKPCVVVPGSWKGMCHSMPGDGGQYCA